MRHSLSSRTFRKAALPVLLMSGFALAGCAAKAPPPEIQYDNIAPAILAADPPAPVTVVSVPEPLRLPGQLKPLPGEKTLPQPARVMAEISRAGKAALRTVRLDTLCLIDPTPSTS